MKKIVLTCLGILFLLPVNLSAQELKGHIVNSKQRPLKGMKVWRKNTTESVITDKLGVFIFPSLLSTDTLVIFVSRKEEAVIPVDKMKEISVKLEKKYFLVFDGNKETKYEYKRSKQPGIDSNVLTREDIIRLSANSIYDLFVGTIPGVRVNDGPSGRVVSIRGGNSFELSTEPLFIVDGVQYEGSADVNRAIAVSDIEKVEVLKEGGAYGVRGSNGAIIITTTKR